MKKGCLLWSLAWYHYSQGKYKKVTILTKASFGRQSILNWCKNRPWMWNHWAIAIYKRLFIFSTYLFSLSFPTLSKLQYFFCGKKGFWFRFCPRQLTTNCPTQLLKERPWVKEILYGKVALRSATKTRLKSFEVKKETYAARLTFLHIFGWD